MTTTEAWTLALIALAGVLQAGGLIWAWARAKANARTARANLEAAIGTIGEGGLTWDQHDHLIPYLGTHIADSTLDSYKGQGIMVLAGILMGTFAGALPILTG